MQHEDISILPIDHPGAHDPIYRARRNYIAELAIGFREHPESGIPKVPYNSIEDETWTKVVGKLKPLHKSHVSKTLLQASEKLNIPLDHVPQLKVLNQELKKFHGFSLEPIGGLVESRAFLTALKHRVMLCTQYIRHSSKPEYTPEPDIVHEVVGHVPSFTDQELVDFSIMIGKLSERASASELQELERLYWYTIEFGLIKEENEVKAFGAGLLSSIGELQNSFSPEVEKKDFNLIEVINTPFDFSKMQTKLFIMPSLTQVRKSAEKHFKHLITV
jgi:phenylalanine-4-hydroxylase